MVWWEQNRELQIMKQLKHSNVVELKCSFYSKGEKVRTCALFLALFPWRAHYSSAQLRYKDLHACKSCAALPGPHSEAGRRHAQELHLRVRHVPQNMRRSVTVADAHTNAHTRDSLRRYI